MNETKTNAIFFTRRTKKQLPRGPLRIGASIINWETRVKYLGLIMDRRLTLKNHIDYSVEKSQKAIRILYSMFNRRSRLSERNKILLSKVAIRPIITYAAPIVRKAAPSHMKRLQIAQNKLLRMILNANRYTRIADLHETANIEMISDFINRLSDNFEARSAAAP